MTTIVSAEIHDRDLERFERKQAAETAARVDALNFAVDIHGSLLRGYANDDRAARALEFASVYAAFILHGETPASTEVAK